MDSPNQEILGVGFLKESIEQITYPAFLCEAKKNNYYDLKIISCNQAFLNRFNLSSAEVIGSNYDLLFEEIDLSSISDFQVQYSHLLKAVKNFYPIIVNLSLNYPGNTKKIGNFKINFTPSDFKIEDNLYCTFVFEELSEVDLQFEERTIQRLAHNLDRAIQNERILHRVSNLIASDLAIKEVSGHIAKIICDHLKVDRCIFYDFNENKISFVVENNSSGSNPITRNKDGEETLEVISPYIDFHHKLSSNFHLEERKGNIMLSSTDIGNDLRFKKIDDICLSYNIVAQIAVTTAFDGKINGGLFIHQSSAREWTVEEIELIEMIADQFSVASDRSFSISQVLISNQNLIAKTQELKKALKQEKEMRQMQNDFVAIVSHEFKTPLQIIDSTRELLARKLKTMGIVEESIDKALAKIKSGVVRMNGLIESTLNLSKLEMSNGDIALNKKDFSVKALINEIIERNYTLASNKLINIEIDIAAFPEIYNGDQKLLDHSFSNIITNAIKYSKNNSLVKIKGFLQDKKLVLKVTDSGIGIPESDVSNIGKKFFRATNTLSVSGTGIGLFLTKYFVELHNGSVLIESVLDVGTTVTVELPIS